MLKKIIKVVVIVWVVVMTVIIGGRAYYNSIINNPLVNLNGTKTITIKNGDTVSTIFSRLSSQKNLRMSFIVKFYASNHSKGITVREGVFDIKPGMSTDDIITAISNAKPVDPNTVRVTIPEGYTIDDIAKLLETKGVITKDKFIDSCKKYDLPPYIKKDTKRRYALEGYLYPDTYDFKKDSDGKAVISTMIKNFERKLAEAQKSAGTTLSTDEVDKIVTLASVIEGEVKASSERKIVASVFYNRLKINMRLESDATVQYAIGQHKPLLSEKDYAIDSPYNTYKVAGIPEGPICSPRMESIEAAINPAETKYLYFVAKNDGTHEFNESFEKHQAAVRKYQSR